MNLTTPPPVEPLDPQYADDVRTELVRQARRGRRKHPAWVPVLAAACGIAVITSGTVVLAQTGDDGSVEPAATPTSVPTTPRAVVPQVPAGNSPRVSLDLGNASIADARAAGRTCLGQSSEGGEQNPATPSDAATATIHQARWLKALPRTGRPASAPGRLLLQTFTTADGVWFHCLDGALLRIYDPAQGGSRETAMSLNAADPVNGQWRTEEVPDGDQSRLFVSYSFAAMPNVHRLEVRIRWTGGASPWYGVTVADGAGYVEATQRGAVFERGEAELDLRAFDVKGNQMWSDVEYG